MIQEEILQHSYLLLFLIQRVLHECGFSKLKASRTKNTGFTVNDSSFQNATSDISYVYEFQGFFPAIQFHEPMKKVSHRQHFRLDQILIGFFLSLIAAKGGKASGGGSGKKGSANTKGVEHDAMGTKWNKSMWDNMESK